MRHRASAALVLLAAAALAAPDAAARWGQDINAGEGPKVVAEVRPELAAIVQAPEAERARLIAAFKDGRAERLTEGWKRFRNPELRDLFRALLDHKDWHVVHRALFALEYYRNPDDLPAAWNLLFHSEPRVREKAAIACIKLWSKKGAAAVSQGDWRGALDSLLRTEPDDHVRSALEALQRRAVGKLPEERVHTEHLERLDDGLLITPFLSGMNNAKAVAPNWAKKGVSKGGGGSAAKLPAVTRWTEPVLGWMQEEVKGVGLQPFANPREGGRVHTGLDLNACMDGSGYYAITDGFVKFVNSGSDMGTLLCTEHHVGDGELVTTVYMHGGDTVFVKGGERVEAGQLLGTMGMGFSIENGGHFAHLHFGLYPGPFQTTHNYGYKSAAAGLADWYDPVVRIPRWVAWTRPPVTAPRGLAAGYDRAVELVDERQYGKAWSGVARDGDPDAAALRAAIEQGVDTLLATAAQVRGDGWPARALALIEDAGRAFKGVPGEDRLAATVDAWEDDPAFERALDAEKAFDRARAQAERLEGKKGADERLRALWDGLLKEYGDTPLAPRIRAARGE